MIINKVKEKQGFTLVEVLAVLVIIAVLSAIAVPAYTGYIRRAKANSHVPEAKLVSEAMQMYLIENKFLDKNQNKSVYDEMFEISQMLFVEISDKEHPLHDILEGSYTDGAYISGIDVDFETGLYTGLEYTVDGYIITISNGENISVMEE